VSAAPRIRPFHPGNESKVPPLPSAGPAAIIRVDDESASDRHPLITFLGYDSASDEHSRMLNDWLEKKQRALQHAVEAKKWPLVQAPNHDPRCRLSDPPMPEVLRCRSRCQENRPDTFSSTISMDCTHRHGRDKDRPRGLNSPGRNPQCANDNPRPTLWDC